MLVTGPDVLTSLVGVLFKVRERKIAVGADIEEMFLQVKIIKEDQQCQRFFSGMAQQEAQRRWKC